MVYSLSLPVQPPNHLSKKYHLIHLITCETYECGGCWKRFKQLNEIKKHMVDKHADFLWRMEMDREDQNRLDYKKHFLFQIEI